MTSIAPWLSVHDATGALAYYVAAFGAVELERLEDDSGEVVVAQLSIDGADFWIQADAESSPDVVSGSAVRMILTVDDPDAAFARAIAAGATEVAAMYEGNGWRIGRLADPSGHLGVVKCFGPTCRREFWPPVVGVGCGLVIAGRC